MSRRAWWYRRGFLAIGHKGQRILETAPFVIWRIRGLVVRANGVFVGVGLTRGAALEHVLEVGLYSDEMSDGTQLLNGVLPPGRVAG